LYDKHIGIYLNVIYIFSIGMVIIILSTTFPLREYSMNYLYLNLFTPTDLYGMVQMKAWTIPF